MELGRTIGAVCTGLENRPVEINRLLLLGSLRLAACRVCILTWALPTSDGSAEVREVPIWDHLSSLPNRYLKRNQVNIGNFRSLFSSYMCFSSLIKRVY